jgi:hypothetical protein
MTPIRAAVIQAAPVVFDVGQTLAKLTDLVADAARQGAQRSGCMSMNNRQRRWYSAPLHSRSLRTTTQGYLDNCCRRWRTWEPRRYPRCSH